MLVEQSNEAGDDWSEERSDKCARTVRLGLGDVSCVTVVGIANTEVRWTSSVDKFLQCIVRRYLWSNDTKQQLTLCIISIFCPSRLAVQNITNIDSNYTANIYQNHLIAFIPQNRVRTEHVIRRYLQGRVGPPNPELIRPHLYCWGFHIQNFLAANWCNRASPHKSHRRLHKEIQYRVISSYK